MCTLREMQKRNQKKTELILKSSSCKSTANSCFPWNSSSLKKKDPYVFRLQLIKFSVSCSIILITRNQMKFLRSIPTLKISSLLILLLKLQEICCVGYWRIEISGGANGNNLHTNCKKCFWGNIAKSNLFSATLKIKSRRPNPWNSCGIKMYKDCYPETESISSMDRWFYVSEQRVKTLNTTINRSINNLGKTVVSSSIIG